MADIKYGFTMLNNSLSNNKVLGDKARKLIPGGAHTYSKGDDQFPANAPRIIDRGEGCYLWDVDNNKHLDLAMSLGSVTLGHAYKPVLDAVQKELIKGSNFCRPSIIEGELAEILVDLIPSAEMVKFGKNGSDAVTAAVKLARAYTGRDYVVRCESDPFNSIHDWFIGSTVINRGVPQAVSDLTLKFKYNDLESCQKLFDEYPGQIACFIFEPVSFEPPKKGFLEGLKALCEKNGTVLIFDEVVSGFRFALGGVQELVGVTPHLSAFGKAMANGFSVSALVGAKEIMEIGGIDHEGERVFLLSTTHGGETHSLAAAIATINEIREKNIISHFEYVGATLKKGINDLSKKHGLENRIKAFGYDVKPGIQFLDNEAQFSSVLRTVFLQEACQENLLVPYIVPSYAHKQEELIKALGKIDMALSRISEIDRSGLLDEYILNTAIKPVFRKFN